MRPILFVLFHSMFSFVSPVCLRRNWFVGACGAVAVAVRFTVLFRSWCMHAHHVAAQLSSESQTTFLIGVA